MTVEDILAQLREGDNIDDIAKDMTTALNEAKRRYEKEQAEAKAKREAELVATMKRTDAAHICTAINKFVEKYYSDVPSGDTPLAADDFITVCDSLAEMFKTFQKVEEKVSPVVEKAKNCGDEFNDAIEDFLNKFVR